MIIRATKAYFSVSVMALICLLPLMSIAQEGEQQIGVKVTPGLSYRSLNGKDAENSQLVTNSRNRNEASILGYSIGVDYLHPVTKQFNLRPGLNFSRKGYKYAPGGSVYNSLEMLCYYDYFDILIRGQYFLSSSDHLQIYLAGGISINLLLDARTHGELNTSYNRSNTGTNFLTSENLHDRNYQAILGFGVQGPITEHFNLAFEPVFRHSITSIGEAPIKTYLWSLGAEMGVYYEF